MQPRPSKTLALLGGIATLVLGSTFVLRLSAPKSRPAQVPCAPRLLELEQSVCEPLRSLPVSQVGQLAAR